MTKIAVKDVDVYVYVYEGPAYYEDGEDGRNVVCNRHAACTVFDGTNYIHVVPFRHRHDAERLVERIKAAGEIDPDHWIKQEPPMSLEDRFALYAEREQEVRWGVRDEEDMYHGI